MPATGHFDIFQKMLVKMSTLSPGLNLKKLSVCLSNFDKDVKRWKKYNAFDNEFYCIVMFQIGTIVHFSMMKSFLSGCLSDVSLNELRRCKKSVHVMMKNPTTSLLESYCLTRNIADQCLITLNKMKKLGQDVSMPSLLLRCLYVNVMVIRYTYRYIHMNNIY